MAFDPIWESIFSSREWGKYPNENIVRFISKSFAKKNRSEMKILDLGCGTGANMWFLTKEGFQTYGIDGSETAVRKCREILDKETPHWKGEVLVADMMDLPFQDSQFDAVIDCASLYCNNLTDTKKIMNELYRVTKKSALFLSITFAKGCVGDGTGEKIDHNYFIPATGPFVGSSPARFTEFSEIASVYHPFIVQNVELITRTVNNMKDTIKEFVIATCKL